MAETPQPPATPRRPNENSGIAVFSGGTAANFLVDVFEKIIAKGGRPLRYIIPISDNGGSSSELIRVFGGPSEWRPFPPFPPSQADALVIDPKQVLVMCEVSEMQTNLPKYLFLEYSSFASTDRVPTLSDVQAALFASSPTTMATRRGRLSRPSSSTVCLPIQ